MVLEDILERVKGVEPTQEKSSKHAAYINKRIDPIHFSIHIYFCLKPFSSCFIHLKGALSGRLSVINISLSVMKPLPFGSGACQLSPAKLCC